MSKDRADESCFCAAKLMVGGDVYVCAGRCLHPDLAKVRPSPKVVLSPKSDANVLAFIEKYGSKPDAQYGWGFELTPRVIMGKDIRDYGRNLLLSNQLVWGEGCDDTQHFDCGGFVRYVVKQVCHTAIAGISADPSKKNAYGKEMGTLVTEGDTVLPADILVYNGHIAFATGVPALP